MMEHDHVDHEHSPLLIDTDESQVHPLHNVRKGNASVPQTVINLAKTCMGTGCLALPYAARQGGLFLTVVGILAIAMWNTFALKLLCDCYDLLVENVPNEIARKLTTGGILTRNMQPETKGPPRGTSTLGLVAWYAMGRAGLNLVDGLTVGLLTGIIVAYQSACRSFLVDVSITTSIGLLDALIIASVMASFSIVPDMGYLSKMSASGLAILAATFLIITGYGIHEFVKGGRPLNFPLTFLPLNGLVGASHWFGCIVFGFGVVPLTYNFYESMAEPKKLVPATTIALLLVACAYIFLGIGLVYLFPDIGGDVLHELPTAGLLPVATRMAMVVVVIATAPLLIVPCGEIIEGKLLAAYATQDQSTTSLAMKVIVRFGLCTLCAFLSACFPGFVGVLSFVGCFCVALVGFCLPPLLHLVLASKYALQTSHDTRVASWVDLSLLIWGVVATCLSTIYTLRQVGML